MWRFGRKDESSFPRLGRVMVPMRRVPSLLLVLAMATAMDDPAAAVVGRFAVLEFQLRKECSIWWWLLLCRFLRSLERSRRLSLAAEPTAFQTQYCKSCGTFVGKICHVLRDFVRRQRSLCERFKHTFYIALSTGGKVFHVRSWLRREKFVSLVDGREERGSFPLPCSLACGC